MNNNEARSVLRDAIKDARGNLDIIVFPCKDYNIIKALEALRIFWCEIDGEIYINRHVVEGTFKE